MKIIATDEVEKALELKKKYNNAVLVGERHEKKPEGFDLGNSPTEILMADLKYQIVIQTTTAGTNGLVNAANADTLITGSLVNAGAIVKFIQSVNPGTVSLVAMGFRAKESAEEDLLCARMIESRLMGKDDNFEDQIANLRHTSGSRFFNPDNIDFSPPTDFFLSTMIDKFDFVIRAERRADGNVDLIRTDV
jgi:2-phosphosulfolactate phosphatase